MSPVRSLVNIVLIGASCIATSCASAPIPAIATPSPPLSPSWQEWSAEAFERAQRENKVVLLSVQAGWCHWCHVMNDTTYTDPAVLRRLNEHFVMVRADGDARPDLADRYRRYAWPATVFLSPEGEQILAIRGYRSPRRFSAILADVLAANADGRALDESLGAPEPELEDLAQVRHMVRAQLDGLYDEEAGGWGRRQRYPFAAPVHHAFFRAWVEGDPEWKARALTSLEAYATLIDPVWGGMYQYSERGVWDRPHFEKIVSVQAGAIRAFAEAYRVTGDEVWLGRADDVIRYVREHLRAADGAFYVSQDADLGGHGQPGPHVPGEDFYALDDAGRRALGAPRVDRAIYASTNGMLIEALAGFHVASGRAHPLSDAVTAAERLLRTHRHPSGLFVHDAEGDDPLLYLSDQAHVLSAFVALHQATGQWRWIDESERLVSAMVEHLERPDGGGFYAHTEDPEAVGLFRERLVPVIDNAITARRLLDLSCIRHSGRYEEIAVATLRACARPGELRRLGRMVGEYALALESLQTGYVLFSVVGPDGPRTDVLHRASVELYEPTRLVALHRPGQGPFPYPGEPAVYLCTREACSIPVTDPEGLLGAMETFLGR